MASYKKKLPELVNQEEMIFIATTAAYKNGVAPEGTRYFDDPYASILNAVTALAILDDKLVSVNRSAYLNEGEPMVVKPGLRSMPVFLYSVPLLDVKEDGALEAQSLLSRLLVIPDWKEFVHYEELTDENLSTDSEPGGEHITGDGSGES